MKINYLKLKNFGNIKEASINFSGGIQMITGNNGEGKSTILKAFSLLLFNYLSGNLLDYIFWGENYFELETEFIHKNSIYKEMIHYDLKKSERELYIDGKFDSKNSDAIKKLNSIFDSKLCLASSVSFEGEIDLVSAKPAERRENLKKIYSIDFKDGINDLDQQQKIIENETIKNLDLKVYSLENKKYNFKEKKSLPFGEQEHEKFTLERDKLKVEKELHEKNLSIYNENLNRSYEIIKIIANLEKDQNEASNKLETLVSEMKKSESEYPEKLKTLNNKISKLKLDLSSDLEGIGSPIDLIRKERDSIQIMRIKSFDSAGMKNKETEKTLIIRDMKDLEDRIKLCKSGKCPTCGKNFESSEIGQYETELENAKLALEQINRDLDIFVSQKNEYEAKIEEQNKMKLRLESLNQQEKTVLQYNNNIKEKIKSEIQLVDQQIESLNKSKMYVESNYKNQEIALLEKVERIKKELFSQKEKLEKLNKENIKPNDSVNFERINELTKKIKEYDDILIINQEADKDNVIIENQKKKDEEELRKLKKEKENLFEEIEIIKKGKSILQKEFPNYIITQLVSKLEYGLNLFLEKTYDKYKLKIEEKKDSIYILYGPQEKECSLASGFEKQIFGLAWKSCLSKLQDLNIMFLDEVDSAASNDNSQKLFDVLGTIKDMYDQLFVISHRTETQDILEMNYNAAVFRAENNTILKIN